MRKYTTDYDVVKCLLGVQSEAVSYRLYSLRSKIALGIDIYNFALTAIELKRQLTRHAKCMCKLRFACSKFSE
jgi:hypothetical protein